MKENIKKTKRELRRKRIRLLIKGTVKRPRMVVFKSLRFIYVQVIDDKAGKTLAQVNEKEIKTGKTKTEKAIEVGKLIAKKCLDKKINIVVFDRAGFKYHGRVKALADAARKAGLKF